MGVGRPFTRSLRPPRGISHRSWPERTSIACRRPQGGLIQGKPIGDQSSSRLIAYGVGVCMSSKPPLLKVTSEVCSEGTRVRTAAALLVLVTRRPEDGS